MTRKFSVDSARARKVDEALTITDLFDGEGFAFDFVVATLRGHHPLVANSASDRAYYVLEGSGSVRVGDETYSVLPGDLVTIPAGTAHGLDGDLRYIIVTAPPFDPRHETTVG